jgi:hypothetical protein
VSAACTLACNPEVAKPALQLIKERWLLLRGEVVLAPPPPAAQDGIPARWPFLCAGVQHAADGLGCACKCTAQVMQLYEAIHPQQTFQACHRQLGALNTRHAAVLSAAARSMQHAHKHPAGDPVTTGLC